MTLTNLYNQLDWSNVKANPDRWYTMYTTLNGKGIVDEDFFRRFWCSVIHSALYSDEADIRKTALILLERVGQKKKLVEIAKKEIGMEYATDEIVPQKPETVSNATDGAKD